MPTGYVLKTSEKFERQIERIHRLIEGSAGSQVVWNDSIPDPDNEDQPRQIDVTIRRDDKLTLVECRIHKDKQDVQWIEELVGRRASLRADAVVAVSASGFTEGAVKKAHAFGIILRDLLSLTEEEISAWGRVSKVSLTFYEYTAVELLFWTHNRVWPVNIVDKIQEFFTQNPREFYGVFEKASELLDEQAPKGQPPAIWMDVGFNTPWSVEGCIIDGVSFQANVRTVNREIATPAVVLYDAPEKGKSEREVSIELTELENFEITKSANNVMIAVDLSSVQTPRNCHFRFVNVHLDRPRRGGLVLLGLPKFRVALENVMIGVRHVENTPDSGAGRSK